VPVTKVYYDKLGAILKYLLNILQKGKTNLKSSFSDWTWNLHVSRKIYMTEQGQ